MLYIFLLFLIWVFVSFISSCLHCMVYIVLLWFFFSLLLHLSSLLLVSFFCSSFSSEPNRLYHYCQSPYSPGVHPLRLFPLVCVKKTPFFYWYVVNNYSDPDVITSLMPSLLLVQFLFLCAPFCGGYFYGFISRSSIIILVCLLFSSFWQKSRRSTSCCFIYGAVYPFVFHHGSQYC